MNILTVNNLCFSYPNVNKLALKDISFSLEKGSYLAILGLNGSGKSTLARIICGFLNPSSGSVTLNIPVTPGKAPSGIVFQNPKSQIISNNIWSDTLLGPQNLKVPSSESSIRAQKYLTLTKLLHKKDDPSSSLSFGQMQKLALSGILALTPELLVLDESVSMIDPSTRKEILDYIDTLHNDGYSIIHITHDIDEAERADRIIVLNEGELVFNDSAKAFLMNEQIKNSIFNKNLPSKYIPSVNSSTITLKFDNVSFGYKKKDNTFTKVIKNLSCEFYKGSLVALTGISGSGKSTFFELAAGLLTPQNGEIFASQKPLLALQECESAIFEEFAADDVAFGPINKGLNRQQVKQHVLNAMKTVGLDPVKYASKKSLSLSGGEKRRLSLAGIIAMDGDVLLFDEPCAGLDPDGRSKVLNTLQTLCNQGKTVIYSTHRIEEANCAEYNYNMEDGALTLVTKAPTRDSSKDTNNESRLINKIPKLEYIKESKLLENLRISSIGMYEPIKSIIHKLPAVTKYILFLGIFFFGIFVPHIPLLFGSIIVSFIYSLLAKTPLKRVCKTLLTVIPWLIIFTFLQFLFIPVIQSDHIIFSFGFFVITKEKIILSVKSILHITTAVLSIYTFLFSINENAIIEGLKKLLPIRSIILVVIVLFRFLPLLSDEATLIIKVQLIRGGLKKKKGFFKQLRSLLPLFVPLLVRTFDRAEEIADALTARYF